MEKLLWQIMGQKKDIEEENVGGNKCIEKNRTYIQNKSVIAVSKRVKLSTSTAGRKAVFVSAAEDIFGGSGRKAVAQTRPAASKMPGASSVSKMPPTLSAIL